MDIKRAKERLIAVLPRRLKACIMVVSMLTLTTGTLVLAGDNVTYDMEKVTPYEFNGDVRALAKYPVTTPTRKPRIHPYYKPSRPRNVPSTLSFLTMELPSLNINVPLAPMPSPSQNFAGMSFNDTCTGGQCGAGWPPDTNGDVGPDYYIQAVNDAYAIYSKGTGTSTPIGTLLASFIEDNLWSSVSATIPCNGNSEGDPIVLYDQLADRWILAHMGWAVDGQGNPKAPFYECIAVSKTSNPVSGGWWLYPVQLDPGGTGKPPSGTLNDYAKFGIWPDCLYMAANGYNMNLSTEPFVGTMYATFSRSDLESGVALQWSLGFNNDTSFDTMIPSSMLGSTPPPANTPNYYVSQAQSTFSFEVRKFTAGTNCGGGGTLGSPVNVSQTNYSRPGTSPYIVPQGGTPNTVDSLGDILMQKVRYRNINGTESLWVVHSVQASSTSPVAPQWAQLDVTGGTISTTPVQQQIYAPDTTLYRWMGSLAVDGSGNMALGYSTSSGTQYPSIAYSGRLATDPLNSLSQTEVQLIAGGGSQTVLFSGNTPVQRWGDYTAMSVDPADDCTFWYTNQYYSSPANGESGNWQTRIGSFKFPFTVTTAVLTSVTTTSATGGGNVTGCAAVSARGVCWNTTANPSTTDGSPCTTDGSGMGVFTSSITGLIPSTSYHVRAYANSTGGIVYGGDVLLTPGVPTVTTSAITVNTTTSATGGGTVTSDGGSAITDRGVCWNTTGNPTTSDTCTHDGTGTGVFTSSVTGLTPGTTYHVRAYATNSVNTSYGSDVSFAPGVPTVTTSAIAGKTATSATGGGNVTSDGGAAVTHKGVCWSTSANPTISGACTDDGTGTGVFTSSITGLTQSTTYHVRAYATNSVITAYGSDLSFTTSVKRPSAPTGLTVQ